MKGMATESLTSKGCWFCAAESIILIGEETGGGARSSVAKETRRRAT